MSEVVQEILFFVPSSAFWGCYQKNISTDMENDLQSQLSEYLNKEKLLAYWHQFRVTISKHLEAVFFIREYRVWEGFWSYGWVIRALIVIGILISVKFLSIIFNWYWEADASTASAALSSLGTLFSKIGSEGFNFIFMGGMKYIVLILLEIVIFHVSRQTLSILLKEDSQASLDAFIKAQIRMIKISGRSWVLETIATFIIKLAFGIFGFLGFLKPVLIFAVHCYYVGFAILDNYHEQFGMSIRDSARYARNFVGVALGVGMILQIIMLVPVVGTVVGPFIGAVAVTLAMYQLSDLHLQPRTEGKAMENFGKEGHLDR